jgi:hypothetical protein
MRLDATCPRTFSQASIDEEHEHENHGAALVLDMDGKRAAGFGDTAQADCISILESLENCLWNTAARVAEEDGFSVFDEHEFQELVTNSIRLGLLKANTLSRPSGLNTKESAEYASVELLESLWEDEDDQKKKSKDDCNLCRSECKFDRSDYRKWIGANGLHTQ